MGPQDPAQTDSGVRDLFVCAADAWCALGLGPGSCLNLAALSNIEETWQTACGYKCYLVIP